MHKFDYELHNGYCGKCREVMEVKRTINHLKEFEGKKWKKMMKILSNFMKKFYL